MRNLIFVLIAGIIFYSCDSKNEIKNNCRYSSGRLIEDFDSALIEVKSFPNGRVYEILDKGSNIGAKGIYKFDEIGRLRFYAFLLSDSNDYTFSRQYDSLGRTIRVTGGEVVQCYFRKISTDSLKITFFLYGLSQKYADINLQYGTTYKTEVELFKSPIFSNILGGSIMTELSKERGKIIYIMGKRLDICSASEYYFRDSVNVPSELFP